MALATALWVAIASPACAGTDALLDRMASVNPNLHSFTAVMKAHVALTTFPFLATDIVATVYHKDPDKNKVEITSGLPLIASQFGNLYPHIEPAARWNDVYTITRVSDDGMRTSYKLVPRTGGNVERIDAVVDDKTATIASMRWTYANGGTAEMFDTYSTVDGNVVVVSQTGQIDEPNYKGTVTATLDHYAMNPALDDSLFDQPS
jgi:hypothetical protein